MHITGNTLINWGFKPGPWFVKAIEAANAAHNDGSDESAIKSLVGTHAPVDYLPLREAIEYHSNIIAEDEAEAANILNVKAHMNELMRLPTVVSAAIMPDACPSDYRLGTIPVGGVVATKDAIHPGMHSADICCSMAISIFGADSDATAILDAGMKISHFGGGGRQRGQQWAVDIDVMKGFEENDFLEPLISPAMEHFGTQGDGNHFFYVGRVASSGQMALVTHHGSRKPGAMLYKAGMAVAEKYRRKLSPETHTWNAWIPAETSAGVDYWHALQTIRAWTKANHFAIHDAIADTLSLTVNDRFWNEHNFVFQKSDGLFYHAKGATPAYKGFAHDDSGLTLIPLNMAEPILITEGSDAPNGLGFAPHGAGRNFGRKAYMRANVDKTPDQMFAEQTVGIDVRSYCGVVDASELPGAYKNAASMRRQIDAFGLAKVVDTVEPIGSIMAGDWQSMMPWRNKGKR